LRIDRRQALADLAAKGARKQRMLWASTGTKDPKSAPGLYVEAAGGARHHRHHAGKDPAGIRGERHINGVMPRTAATANSVLAKFAAAGIDVDALAAQLQVEGAASFVKSWAELMKRIADKSAALASA
jgi:transaldolase